MPIVVISVLGKLFRVPEHAKDLLSEAEAKAKAKAEAKDDRKNHNLELERRIFGNGHPLSLPEDVPSTSQSALPQGVEEDLPSTSQSATQGVKKDLPSVPKRERGPATQVYDVLDKLFPLNTTTPSNTPLPLRGRVGNDKPPQR
jgi:cation transport regulator ChaB